MSIDHGAIDNSNDIKNDADIEFDKCVNSEGNSNESIDSYDNEEEIDDEEIVTIDSFNEEEAEQFLPTSSFSSLRSNSSSFNVLAIILFLALFGMPFLLINKTDALVDHALYDEAVRNLGDVTDPIEDTDTALYWHIPKAGGTSVKQYYSCMGLAEDLDTTREDGIYRAIDIGMAENDFADIAVTMFAGLAAKMFTPEYRGRPFVLFRHPVDRMASLFYYLQIATWERTYSPELADMDIETYFETRSGNGGYTVSLLLNKKRGDPITEEDVTLAKQILKDKYLVGLVTKMEESIDRFDNFFGWYENDFRSSCIKQYIHHPVNNNPHKVVKEGSRAWDLAVEKNWPDMELYDYAVQLFEEQGNFIF